MFFTKSEIPVKRTFFRKQIIVPDNEAINRFIAFHVKQLDFRARELGWNTKKIDGVKEAIQLGLFSRIKRWFGTHFATKCNSIGATVAISEFDESPSFFVGEEGEECAEFRKMCAEQRNEEIARTLGELGMKKVEEAEVRVETPAGNFVGKIDFATAKKLQDRLGYGCEVWWKEVNP